MKAGSPRSAGPNRPAAVPMVGGGLLPLAFILLGLAALAASGVWLLWQPALLGLPYFHPHVVAFVHLWLPGFLLSVCIGAVYQLMPVVLGAPLRLGRDHAVEVERVIPNALRRSRSDPARWEQRAPPAHSASPKRFVSIEWMWDGVSTLWIHFGLHAAGVSLLVAAFASGHFAWAGVGGTLISVGVGILFTAVLRTFARADRRDAPTWCFPLATGWLAATVLAGVTMAANRHSPWLPLSMMDLLRAHAHLGLAGFFLTLLQGTTFQLIPMFTMGELCRPRLVWTGLLATQAGLLALIPGLAWDRTVFICTGTAIVAAGIACTGLALHATLRSRRRKKVEPGIRAFVLGAILLGLATLIAAALLFVPTGNPAVMRVVTAYGVILIPGALSLMVLGMLCKIVPFLVWMRAYGPKVGKQPVPIATVLASRSLEHLWLVLHLIGLALLVAGFAVTGGIALAVASAFFLANIVRVLAHLRDRHEPVVTLAKPQLSP